MPPRPPKSPGSLCKGGPHRLRSCHAARCRSCCRFANRTCSLCSGALGTSLLPEPSPPSARSGSCDERTISWWPFAPLESPSKTLSREDYYLMLFLGYEDQGSGFKWLESKPTRNESGLWGPRRQRQQGIKKGTTGDRTFPSERDTSERMEAKPRFCPSKSLRGQGAT